METPFVDIHTHHHDGSANAEARAIVNYGMLDGVPPVEDGGGAFSYGVHPWWFDEHPEPEFLERQLSLLEELLQNGRLAAIGETGFDKVHKQTLALQKTAFERHILLSERYHKPLIIHNVRGSQEVLALHKDHRPRQAWIIHGFNGTEEEAKQFTDKGLSLSVGEAVFHENRKIAKSIMSIPLDHLFLETDTGAYSIEEIYAEVSRRIGVPVGTLREQILQNFERIKK